MRRRIHRSPLTWAFVPYAVTSAAHVVLLAITSPLATPTKLMLMPLLALPILVAIRRTASIEVTALLLLAVLLSWLGDGAGVFFPDGPELPLMLLFFGLAHLVYIALFLRRLAARRVPLWAAVYAVWWIAMMITLGPHTGALLMAVAIYGLVLAGTAALATRSHPLVTAGGAFFLASDTLLAFRLFLPGSLPEWSNPAIMITYTLGQGLIVAGALIHTRKRGS